MEISLGLFLIVLLRLSTPSHNTKSLETGVGIQSKSIYCSPTFLIQYDMLRAPYIWVDGNEVKLRVAIVPSRPWECSHRNSVPPADDSVGVSCRVYYRSMLARHEMYSS